MTLTCGPHTSVAEEWASNCQLRKAGAILSFRVSNPAWREELACHVSKSDKCVNDRR
jgi:hypothetical protein